MIQSGKLISQRKIFFKSCKRISGIKKSRYAIGLFSLKAADLAQIDDEVDELPEDKEESEAWVA